MNRVIRISTALSLLLTAAAVHAEYKCDTSTWQVDQRACEAAKQDPQALRRYILRMQPFATLHFPDYVNKATLLAWEAKEAREAQEASEERERAAARVARRSDPGPAQ
jgi:hypothetical protein